MRKTTMLIGLIVSIFLMFWGCSREMTPEQIAGGLQLPYQKYTLPNGLDVILHQDSSDPIVAVAVVYHVGSSREKPGKTGFAHLFEHIMFQESENVPQDQFFKKIQDAGGTLNGGTFEDGTIYFQVVPKNALEMVLWMESDRMGYLLGALDQEAFHNQQMVVMNEKRQRQDNSPYGQRNFIIGKLLYPEGHPYNWQVIGSMEDIANATLDDVKSFFKKWYSPGNATLCIAGDFDQEQTAAWIKKYFGEIPGKKKMDIRKPWHPVLEETKNYYYQDKFARVPELTIVWPTVENYQEDEAALSLLGDALSDGKKTVLYRRIVEDSKLSGSISAWQSSKEIAGTFSIQSRSFADKNLTDLYDEVRKSLDEFAENGISEQELKRIKATFEKSFYQNLSSILSKSFTLAMYNVYKGDPGYIQQDLLRYLKVTRDDIMDVFKRYIYKKPHVALSVVPKGKIEQAVKDAKEYIVPEDEATPPPVKPGTNIVKTRTPASFDRSVEPPKGPAPELHIPSPYHYSYDNGMKLIGLEQKELPLVNFSIALDGGHRLDPLDKPGIANLVAQLMNEGTKERTPAELEEAIDLLGSSISIRAGDEVIVLSGSALSRNLDKTLDIAFEMLLEPRWDEKEFARIKDKLKNQIDQWESNPTQIARLMFDKLLYGDSHILSTPSLGTRESIDAITIDDLKNYYQKYFVPQLSSIVIVGSVDQNQAISAFDRLNSLWQRKEVELPEIPEPPELKNAQMFIVNFPKAPQSVIRIGKIALPYSHPDYYPCTVMNYPLGGSFNGTVNMILREEKGYTYGARSFFSGSKYTGTFGAGAGVQTNATSESVQIFKEEMEKMWNGVTDEQLTFTKRALLNSMARNFETLRQLQGMLSLIIRYDLPDDYIMQHQKIIREMTGDKMAELARKYLTTDRMIYLIVGDSEKITPGLEKLKIAPVKQLDIKGNPL